MPFESTFVLHRAESEAEHAHDGEHRKREIEMRATLPRLRLDHEARHDRDRDHVGERDQERKPGHTRDLDDLDQQMLRVQRGAEHVPAPAGEERGAHELRRHPRAREQEGEPQIVHRAEPRRVNRGRRLVCRRADHDAAALLFRRTPRFLVVA